VHFYTTKHHRIVHKYANWEFCTVKHRSHIIRTIFMNISCDSVMFVDRGNCCSHSMCVFNLD